MKVGLGVTTLAGTVLMLAALPLTFGVDWRAGAAALVASVALWARSLWLYARLVAAAGCTLAESPDP